MALKFYELAYQSARLLRTNTEAVAKFSYDKYEQYNNIPTSSTNTILSGGFYYEKQKHHRKSIACYPLHPFSDIRLAAQLRKINLEIIK